MNRAKISVAVTLSTSPTRTQRAHYVFVVMTYHNDYVTFWWVLITACCDLVGRHVGGEAWRWSAAAAAWHPVTGVIPLQYVTGVIPS